MKTRLLLSCIGFATLISGAALANRSNVDVIVPCHRRYGITHQTVTRTTTRARVAVFIKIRIIQKARYYGLKVRFYNVCVMPVLLAPIH